MSTTAEIAGLTILGGQLDDLVESRQRLVGLVLRELDGGDAQADLGVIRFEFEGAEVFRQCVVGSSLGFEQPAQGKMSPGPVGVDLDRRLRSA